MFLDKPNSIGGFVTLSMKLLDSFGRISVSSIHDYNLTSCFCGFLAPLSHRGGRIERDTVSPGPSPREGSHLTDRREGKYIY